MSTEETEGIVVMEALACRAHTLVRDIPVYADWLTDGADVHKAKDLGMFIEKTADMLTGRLPDVTAAGRRVAQARSLSATGEKLREIYRRENILSDI